MADKAVVYDPRSAESIADPYPAFARLRAEAPAYWIEREGVWAISRAADVEAVMLDWRSFSSAKGNIVHEDPQRVGRTLTTNDPPRHDQLRRLIGSGYTPKRVMEQAERIERMVDDLIARLDGREIDFAHDFASPLAGGVVGSLIGIPDEDLDYLQKLIDEGIQVDDIDGEGGGNGIGPVFDFLAEVVRDRRKKPRNDMISAFCAADDAGITMSERDIAVTCGSLLGAGFTSTAHMMTNIIHALAKFPDQRRKVIEDPSLIPAMIEEGVRYDVSTFCFARQTTCEVEIGGAVIPHNSRVMVLLGSANRDPARFDDPDRFDINRSTKVRHLGFNVGIHHCMGSSLARLEMKIAFEKILPLLGEFELDEANAVRVRSLNFRGFRKQPLAIRKERKAT